MWRTQYPIPDLDEHGNGMIADGPNVKNLTDLVHAFWGARIELPELADMVVGPGGDGWFYVDSRSDGKSYARFQAV